MKSQNALLAVIVLTGIGCSTGTVTSSSASVRPTSKPGYIRFLNLTSQPADVEFDGMKMISGLQPDELSPGVITSPKSQKVTGTAEKSIEPITFKPSAGLFETIIISKSNGKNVFETVTGETMIAPATGISIELINLTDQPVDFSSASQKSKVKPKSSISYPELEGSHSVEVAGAGKVDFDTKPKEIWGVCVFKLDGKLKSQSVRLKGPLKPSVSGASPMG